MNKYTIEDIKKSMKSEGYTLLSAEYSSIRKMDYICPQGHKSSMLSCNWFGGKRCPVCKGIKIGNSKRMPFDIVKSSFETEGYVLLSEDSEYKNNRVKLRYRCPKGHTHGVAWTKWQQGRRCPFCAKNSKVHYKDVKLSFELEGYKLFSLKYEYNGKLEYECPVGHRHSMVWGHWQQGKRCPTCFRIKMSGPTHPQWKGGISCEPYCKEWASDLKEYIKERDGHSCLNPHCFNDCDVLAVHHINYNKKGCRPGNLITLCRSCNSRANKDRDWHASWYNAIMFRRGYIKDLGGPYAR